MAPTCYNNMKNIHYRTHSLPESVYTHQMLHLTQQHQDYHHGHLHHHQLASHQAAMIKKRNALRRSQTSVCDLLQQQHQQHQQPVAHHRAPLTAGVYEQFLPPPNFNAIGLPVQQQQHSRVSRQRTQSFYVPHSSQQHFQRSAGLSRLSSHHELQQQTSPYYCDPAWYHRSVPNIPSSYPLQQQQQQQQQASSSQKSVTSPLFVDCSVEYDLGEQPKVPADSEPLLSIHPDYIKKCRSLPASPYDRKKQFVESHKSLEDVGSASKRMLMDVRPSCRVARSTRSSPRLAAAARNINNNNQTELRKLSSDSRDSGIGLGMQQSAVSSSAVSGSSMTASQWQSLGYNSSCDSYQSTPHLMTEYQGKMINNKRFGLSGMNSASSFTDASSPTTALKNHYQNLRIYYQLAF